MCSRPFETRSLPSSLAATHRDFAFYVAVPTAPFAAMSRRDRRDARVTLPNEAIGEV
jgi:hypothetical protein